MAEVIWPRALRGALLQSPVTACGCFEALAVLLPMAGAIMIVDRDFRGETTPCGMPFSTLAGTVGGGAQSPGFLGISKVTIGSKKFIAVEGGIGRVACPWPHREEASRMKRWIPVLCLSLLATAAITAAAEKPPAAPQAVSGKTGTVLQVSNLMREAEKRKGPLQVEGVVSKVYPKEQKLGLIDTAEFKRCGVVTCADMVLPVRWAGVMPEVKTQVRLEGEVRKSGDGLEFVAKSLEKVPAR